MSNELALFADAIASAGMLPPSEIKADGKIHRFSSDGKRGKKTGWYVLHADGDACGAFGDWRTGLKQRWNQKSVVPMTNAERLRKRAQSRFNVFLRDAVLRARQRSAARKAIWRWGRATPCRCHDYLQRKGIESHGVRIDVSGNLLVPLRDAEGSLHSLQIIAPDGTKTFMLDGRTKGCYFCIGRLNTVVIICEGFATGASIHECTGHAVAVAFSANNLGTVALALRNKYPGLKIIIAADDDYRTKGNPGLTHAKAAAQKVEGIVAVPTFREISK